MVISIGGIYKIDNTRYQNNYLSVLDVNTYSYSRNINILGYYTSDNLEKYNRIGCKAILLNSNEQNIFKKALYTTAIFGGIDTGTRKGSVSAE